MTPRVLIVDGNEADRATLVGMLDGGGYELDEAPDGIEAFEKLLAPTWPSCWPGSTGRPTRWA